MYNINFPPLPPPCRCYHNPPKNPFSILPNVITYYNAGSPISSNNDSSTLERLLDKATIDRASIDEILQDDYDDQAAFAKFARSILKLMDDDEDVPAPPQDLFKSKCSFSLRLPHSSFPNMCTCGHGVTYRDYKSNDYSHRDYKGNDHKVKSNFISKVTPVAVTFRDHFPKGIPRNHST
jgi:serine/threonine protein kinase